jgi:chromosome segregation ATPase
VKNQLIESNQLLNSAKKNIGLKECEIAEHVLKIGNLKRQNDDLIESNREQIEVKDISIAFLNDNCEEQLKEIELQNKTIKESNQNLSIANSKISLLNSSLEELKTNINEKDTEISAAAAETLKTFVANEQSIL